MSSSLVISIESSESSTNNLSNIVKDTSNPRELLRALKRYFMALASGAKSGVVKISVSSSAPVHASATATCASVAADDTITIGGTVLTAKASPSGENQFSQAGSDTADAASLAAAINAHSVIGLKVSASSSAGVVTITSHAPGAIGNLITLVSSNGSRLAVTGSGVLASGAGGSESAPISFQVS